MLDIFTNWWGLVWLTVTNVVTFFLTLLFIAWCATNEVDDEDADGDDEDDSTRPVVVYATTDGSATALRERILQLEAANAALKGMLKNCDAGIDDSAERA